MSAYDDLPDAAPSAPSAYDSLPQGPAPITSMAYGGIQGATLGNAAKVSAAGRAYVVNPVLDWLESKGIGYGGSGQTYAQMRDEYNANNSAMQQANPIAYGTGAVAGSLPAVAATGGNIAGLAGVGAVQGAGETAANPDEFASNVVKGAGVNAALGVVGGVIPGLATLAKNALVKQYAAEAGISVEEAAQDFLNNLKNGTNQAVTSDVAKRTAAQVAETAGRLAVPVAGSVVGGYAGGKVAEATGLDPRIGQIVGAELGGGAGAAAAWKRGVAGQTATGIRDTLGYAQSSIPGTIKNVSGAVPAVVAAGQSINNQTPDPYSNLPNANKSRLMNLVEELKQAQSGYQD